MPLNLNIFDPDHRFGATALARSRDPARQKQGIALLGGIDKRAELRAESEAKAREATQGVFLQILENGLKTGFAGTTNPQDTFRKVVDGATGGKFVGELPPVESLVGKEDEVKRVVEIVKAGGGTLDAGSMLDAATGAGVGALRIGTSESEKPLSTPGKVLSDRQRVIDKFGASSPELAQFDALAAKPGTTINIGAEKRETEFGKAAGKTDADIRERLIVAGESAVAGEEDLNQMRQILTDPDFQAGSLQPAITALQGLAADIGVDLNALGKEIGVGDLADKQEYNRLSRRVMIEGFQKFKGNLNQKEVVIAEEAFPHIGKSEEANRRSVAALIASQRLARERAAVAVNATASEIRALSKEILSGGTERFENILAQVEKEMEEDVVIERLIRGEIDPATLTEEQKAELMPRLQRRRKLRGL